MLPEIPQRPRTEGHRPLFPPESRFSRDTAAPCSEHRKERRSSPRILRETDPLRLPADSERPDAFRRGTAAAKAGRCGRSAARRKYPMYRRSSCRQRFSPPALPLEAPWYLRISATPGEAETAAPYGRRSKGKPPHGPAGGILQPGARSARPPAVWRGNSLPESRAYSSLPPLWAGC